MKITEQYRKQQMLLHSMTDYGVAAKVYAPMVSRLIDELGVTELLDYGSGRGTLAAYLKADHKVKLQFYDPAIPDYAADPVPMQMCVCIDVLEHVEPECLVDVLDDLKRVTQTVGFFTISTRLAEKFLADGRNAHLILESPEWWWEKIVSRFEIQLFQRLRDEGCFFLVYAKPDASRILIPGASCH